MRLIDADALLEALTSKEIINLRHVIDLITNAPTVQREGWVSVDDRLPEISEEVLIYETYSSSMDAEFGILISSRTDTHWNRPFFCNITHWQPLPAAPKE